MEKGPSLKEVSILQGWRCNSETVELEGTRGVQPDRECLNNIVPQPDPAGTPQGGSVFNDVEKC